MFKSLSLCSIMLLFVQFADQQATTANEAPIIETTLGRIRGSVLNSHKGRDFYAYRGIYYAKAPTGLRRFAPPEQVEPWNGTLEALADGPTCPQKYSGLQLDEDCLSLNVFTPNATSSYPVIVYLHGGVNIIGSANSENSVRPDYLLDEDVVLVSVFFRLGAFGFLSTGTKEAPGNYGYLDQLLALKWVQEHIANFGGDPNRVTLMGYSAGSMAVTLHLVSPLSAGLFHGAIALSGSATTHADIGNVYWSRRLAHELGCPKSETQYLLNCLRKVDWEDIVDVCSPWESYGLTNMKWNFEIDGNFLTEHPTEAVRAGRFNRVPIITGVTYNEFEFDVLKLQDDSDLLADINLNLTLYGPDFLDFQPTGNDDERMKSARQFYFNTTSINKNTLRALGSLKSDCIIGQNVHRLVELAKDYTNVYFYRFDYIVEVTGHQGVGHGDDVKMIFPTITTLIGENSTDSFMVERMAKLFSSFAANGTPPLIENVTWPPFTANNKVVMYMDRQPYTGGPFFEERYALWDKLFPLAESGAELQLPAMVLLVFAAIWNIFA